MVVKVRLAKSLFDIPREEYLAPGHTACPACGATLAARLILKASGPDVIIVNPTGCLEVTTTIYPYTAWGVPYIHVAFENAGAVASGIEAAIKALNKNGLLRRSTRVIAIAGDGGTFDIGLQSLSGMLERGHGVLYVLYDNEAYMNTGIQRSGGTPKFAKTTTMPAGTIIRGKIQRKKDIMSIVIAHHIPYAATANVAYPIDLVNKVRKALSYLDEGPAFIHVLAPCPPGWGFPDERMIEIARLATETGYFPLYEWDHDRLIINPPSDMYMDRRLRKPLREFVKAQSRWSHITDEEIKELEKDVDDFLNYLWRLSMSSGVSILY
ncbi:thiamine pyrophosphate-dependent enzyme [Vulcanisaeta distributa]|uniref:2-oxoacid oxidoreductase (ferredoxin) n=1 Tax=Vulcanisaeta distributa (strain DSM 14429 / JCM 11212 / NBRC 100878 / IC-017) TaxID=572478 RepID=E1QNB9_VULDI|nr:thiamine pyrophosphate-dependent enzyme [Vulcanisaeta distributa]ADN50089.1 thiamine pyrophosphate protein domain protein TPP-binding protein [Vulcanisaeta distributa DSM 14429]